MFIFLAQTLTLEGILKILEEVLGSVIIPFQRCGKKALAAPGSFFLLLKL